MTSQKQLNEVKSVTENLAQLLADEGNQTGATALQSVSEFISNMTARSPNGQSPDAVREAVARTEEACACPHCDRSFATANDVYQHAKAKHGKKLARVLKPVVEREPSMGSLVAEAMMDRACGLPVEPWIAEMFDV